ncbi:MAG: ribonucleoside triphosphate reductase, partial [Chitinispirillaceae bacterium]|nr:ribonucleoside triphosphate reductase [Chitinispirillaceae bacterium]
ALSSFDTYLAPFVRADNLSYKEVKQQIQSFVFGVNTPSRWGSQAPFTNITLDWVVPEDLKDVPAIVGGKPTEHTYGEFQKEMDMINKALLEVLIEGDADGRGFSYPIPTYNITKNFNWDSENATLLFKMTGKYGTPYFQNFVNSSLKPQDVRSMCCRLQLDKRELRNRGGGLFGADEFTGSIGVVTINMPRIGYLSSSVDEYFRMLDRLMDLAKESLEIKRECISRLMDQGLFPYTKRYLRHWNNHFSTIGLIGMNESTLNFMGKDLTHPEAREFAKEVLIHMREKLVKYQTETGHLFNLEATPGEGTSYRLAKIDRQKFPRMIIPGGDTPFYTNSTQLPVDATDDIFEALDMQNDLQKLYTGGTVFHAFIGESIDDPEVCKKLVRKIAENYEIPYFTITPTFSVCQNHGYIKGEHFSCPKCEKETEVYSRIVGYYRPVQHWNAGKKAEFNQRKLFLVEREKESYRVNMHQVKKEITEFKMQKESILCGNELPASAGG